MCIVYIDPCLGKVYFLFILYLERASAIAGLLKYWCLMCLMYNLTLNIYVLGCDSVTILSLEVSLSSTYLSLLSFAIYC